MYAYPISALVLSVVFSILCGEGAGFWPFNTFASANLQFNDQNVKNVAIIGAGAAGASTAYHLHKFAKETGLEINITVLEKSSYVGGRSTTVNAFNDPLEPVELGASIFVEANKILKDAVDEFGLQPQPHKSMGDEPEILGIWNGEKFVYIQKGDASWLDLAKLFWKYGLAPIRTQRLMRKTVGKFLKLYEPPFFPFRSLSDRALVLGLTWVTAITGEQFLAANNIGPPFTTDIIQASTRVNYGQNLGIIHGLETMVCMAIEGATSIERGNWQIFDHMLKAAKANVVLNTTVAAIKKHNRGYVLEYSSSKDSPDMGLAVEKIFDMIVLAAPLQFSSIKLEEDLLNHVPDDIPYVKLHVTLFTSPLKLCGTHFNLKKGQEVPNTILTTLLPEEDTGDREQIVGKSGFFSISTLKTVTNPRTKRKEFIYKIFSPKKVTEAFLANIFCIQPAADGVSIFDTRAGNIISWYYPHVWDSYPYEYPRVTFEETELAKGFYYTAGMESFISTMETSALMGMNVAQLMVDDFLEVIVALNVQGSTRSEPRLEL